MNGFHELTPGLSIDGVIPGASVTVVHLIPHSATSAQLLYRLADGTIRERLLSSADLPTLTPSAARAFGFDGDPAHFVLATEARRIDLAFLFDPMIAVHTSNVDPLPHQITAVYEAMLPRQPLRFVLADDPGAGKTIMAGLYIRELVMRADARRILVVSPGSLVEQWRDELREKFGLDFRVYSHDLEAASPSGNPFEDHPQLIIRLDQVSRNESLSEKVCLAGWDLVIFDEAHKLSAQYFGNEVKKTRRFQFAEALGGHTRHLLLMTATPHNGKEADFHLFLSLLDSDRFYGKPRDALHAIDASDLMRRMVKEELVKFDGTPLFPERRAYTVNYALSDPEAALYEAVTQYVKHEMGKADHLDGKQRGSVGFALTTLQRRLASSPEAVHKSLLRRRQRLESRLREARIELRGAALLRQPRPPAFLDDDFDEDDLDAAEQESLEETLVDEASASRTVGELEAELILLSSLEQRALDLVNSGKDRKWDELSRLLQDAPEMRAPGGARRKLIVFTEHRDTLNYLYRRITSLLGDIDAVVTIHGSVPRDARREAQERFRTDPTVSVLLATDAAGEGVNLQNANLMVNYDLPWNPNRLEQRFGRIHRIGQTEVCHLWNLVAAETREGDVYHRLLEKLRIESEALEGRVFDILGEVFEGTNLRDLLVEAIRYGDRPDVRARLHTAIDQALDHTHLRDILDRNALTNETMTPERLHAVRDEMEKAEARRLQPYFVRSFFIKAARDLGASVHPRELGRHEVTAVPAIIRERDRLITGRNRRETAPVMRRYERIAFTRDALRPAGRPGLPAAILMHPGHPLMLAMTDLILERHGPVLRQGAILVDPTDDGDTPHLLTLLTHEVRAATGDVLSKRLEFIRVDPTGATAWAGWAPHLDLAPASPTDLPLLAPLRDAPWLRTDIEARAVALAASSLAPRHFEEVSGRRLAHIDKTLHAVHERLSREIAFWTDRYARLTEDREAGKDVRLPIERVKRTLDDLQQRLDARRRELLEMRHMTASTPVVLGAALVVPGGLLARLRVQHGLDDPPADLSLLTPVDPAVRARTERIAMDAVRRLEEARGATVIDKSADKCGWDLTVLPPSTGDRLPDPKHVEVKGRLKGAETITITRNEILYGLNQADKFILAIVIVDPDDDDAYEGPFYIHRPFSNEPDFGVESSNFKIADLLTKAVAP